MRHHKQKQQPPLSHAEILLLRKDPQKFIEKNPSRVMLQMQKDSDGIYEVSEIAIVIR